jgi:hypothetical protein
VTIFQDVGKKLNAVIVPGIDDMLSFLTVIDVDFVFEMNLDWSVDTSTK